MSTTGSPSAKEGSSIARAASNSARTPSLLIATGDPNAPFEGELANPRLERSAQRAVAREHHLEADAFGGQHR